MGMVRSAALALLLLGCSPNSIDTKERMRQEIANIQGDRVRRAAECQAQSLQFPGNTELIQSCVELDRALRLGEDQAIADLNKRISQ